MRGVRFLHIISANSFPLFISLFYSHFFNLILIFSHFIAMRLLICIVLLVSPTKCRGEVDDMIRKLEAAAKTRTLHMKKLLNTADEIDLVNLEFNRQTIRGHGVALLGGDNYIIKTFVRPCIVHSIFRCCCHSYGGCHPVHGRTRLSCSCRSRSSCWGRRSGLERS